MISIIGEIYVINILLKIFIIFILYGKVIYFKILINNIYIYYLKLMNLYENWVKKDIMLLILKKSKEISLFNNHTNIIYIKMIEVIFQYIKNNFNLLTKDQQQFLYYENMFNSIYQNLYNCYGIKDYKIYNYGLFYYYYIYNINNSLNLLIDYETDEEYLPIEIFFRGIHQIIEINLLYLMKEQDKIETILNIDNDVVKEIIYHCISIWRELIELLNILSSLDELKYQKYRNLIYGTSGGDSINLRKIQKRIQKLDTFVSFDIHDTIINQRKDKYLLSAIKLYQYYSTQFWLTHFNLASSTNGIQNKGTKDTPILKLIDKCIHMTNTKINQTIFDISKEVNDSKSKIKVKINDNEKLIGISIYNSSKSILKLVE